MAIRRSWNPVLGQQKPSGPEVQLPARRFSSNLLGAWVLSSVACLTFGSLAWASTPSLGLYEPNIYASVPAISWIASFLAIVLPILVFGLSLWRRFSSESLTRWLVLAFASADVGFLFIP